MKFNGLMVSGLLIVLASVAMFTITSCSGDKPGVKKSPTEIAHTAGTAAGLAYTFIEDDAATKEVAAEVTALLEREIRDYVEGGFIKTADGINLAIDKLSIDDNKKKVAKKFARMLLVELDKLFEDNPSFKEKGKEVALIVAEFLRGANETIKG